MGNISYSYLALMVKRNERNMVIIGGKFVRFLKNRSEDKLFFFLGGNSRVNQNAENSIRKTL